MNVFFLQIKKFGNTCAIIDFARDGYERASEMANAHFVYDIAGMYTRVFAEMMEKGCLKKCDPEILAFSYSAPISVLIRMCDRSPEKEPEVMEKIDRFVKQFIEQYGISG